MLLGDFQVAAQNVMGGGGIMVEGGAIFTGTRVCMRKSGRQ